MAAGTLLVIEGLARLAYWSTYGEGFSLDELRRTAASADGATKPAAQNGDGGFRILHPYFGYTDNVPDLPLNVFPPPGDDGEFHIAVVGGSVARQVSQPIEQRLRELATARGIDAPIKVYACNAGGFKQPQQVMVLGWLLSMGAHYDVVINVDGYNEVALSGGENVNLHVFPFYPRAWSSYLTGGVLADGQALLGRLQLAAEERQALLGGAWTDALSFTALYGLWLRIELDNNTETQREMTRRALALDQDYSLERNGPGYAYPDSAALFAAIAEGWARGSRLLLALSQSVGAQYLHVLQPNQYLPGSKPLSEQELATAFNPEHVYLPAVRDGYPLLRAKGQELLADGVDFLDLTQVFASSTETLYVDDCCHFNKVGVRRLSEAIVEHLLAKSTAPLLRSLAAP